MLGNNISILDCTLRDGGYCNNWEFGKNNIQFIMDNLIAANIEYIECGYLNYYCEKNEERTVYKCVKDIPILKNSNTVCVAMVNYGEYPIDKLPARNETSVDGIRVAFHKDKWNEALDYVATVKENGYKVFVQPMVSMLYSDNEFTDLIHEVNKIKPYSFYLVDSFGTMKKNDMVKYTEIIKSELCKKIKVGFHAHNNLQMAYSNALTYIENMYEFDIITDSSVYGMGRGAGNLNSELIAAELNEEYGKNYSINYLLSIMDEVLAFFYERRRWGYTLPNYMSARHMIHPQYAYYLSSKETLKYSDIDKIFSQIDIVSGREFNKEYIEKLYSQYMSSRKSKNCDINEIYNVVKNKRIVLLAPGKKAVDEIEKIEKFLKADDIVISINYVHPTIKSDYVFVSNLRRFSSIDEEYYGKVINTSNVSTDKTYLTVDYKALLGNDGFDNAGIMAIRFVLRMLKKEEVYIAGLDGYSYNDENNYANRSLIYHVDADLFNNRIMKELTILGDEIKITFITSSVFANE